MIKMKNCGDFVAELTINGAQATGTTASARTSCIAPFAGRISAIFGRLQTPGTGTQTTDVLVNGATLVSSGTLLSYATNIVPTYNTGNLLTNPPLVNKGDVITLQNTAVGSPVANDQSVYVTIERQRSGSFADPVQTDTVGSDSDTI
jgi:hypothetical protein